MDPEICFDRSLRFTADRERGRETHLVVGMVDHSLRRDLAAVGVGRYQGGTLREGGEFELSERVLPAGQI